MDDLFLLLVWLAAFLLALGAAAGIAELLIDRCRKQGCFRSRTRIDWRRGR